MNKDEEKILSLVLHITNPVGLHARPAALFVQTAGSFQAQIQVRNLSRETPFVDAKSILGVLSLGAAQGHAIEIRASGKDAAEALQALKQLVEGNFHESESPS